MLFLWQNQQDTSRTVIPDTSGNDDYTFELGKDSSGVIQIVQDTTRPDSVFQIKLKDESSVLDSASLNKSQQDKKFKQDTIPDFKLTKKKIDSIDTDKASIFSYENEDFTPSEDKNYFDLHNFRRDPKDETTFGFPSVKDPEGFESVLSIDSVGGKFINKETYDSVDVSYPYEITLNDYLKHRRYQLRSDIWDSLLTSYDLKKALAGGDLARLLGAATGLAIPIPPNPVMSIFGKPEISINVSGEVNLRMGYRWDSQNLGTVSAFGQSQATPIFNQDIRVNVGAKIGDKLSFGTDWNTNRTFDYKNEFKIGYEGYDDDIIKLVEVGDVSLPLQSSLIGGGNALFGVRADFQFGPLYLKTLFSQRRGERRFVDVRGGASNQPFQLRAYDFAKNHFFLNTAYKAIYKEYFSYSTPVIPPSASPLRIKGDIQVYESTPDVRDVQSAYAVAYADLEGKRLKQGEKYDPLLKQGQIQSGSVESGRFIRLDSNRFKIDYNLGTLTILNLRQDRNYAVYYRVEDSLPSPDDDIYYGTPPDFSNTKDTLILQLIYTQGLQPKFATLWDRQMKNIYSINATNVNVEETKISVWYVNNNNDSSDVLEDAPDKLVTILGVDQSNNSTGAPPPDGQFDLIPPFFNSLTGEIVFPDPEPFRGRLVKYFTDKGNPDLAEKYTFGDVYDTTYDIARRNTARDRFVISGEVSGRATNRISLGAFNLAPGSVNVTLEGRPLKEYQDYIVDYYAGTLTLRNQQAMMPNANLKIEYEQHDIFNISTRTLAGVRGDYVFLRSRTVDAGLGFTLMHYDQSALIDRVRLGDEPVSNTMFGLDGNVNWDTPWLTKMLDALPFFDTKANSSMSLRGEIAVILPDPNKRTSEVASDMGEPVVYIDDFEGAQRYISLGLNPTQWYHSSQPIDLSIAADEVQSALLRGRMYWFQYFIPRIDQREIWPNRSVVTGRRNISPLEINFNPDYRGLYNKNPQYLDPFNPQFDSTDIFGRKPENRDKIWSGMMRLFSSFNTNFDNENIEYIEIMMRVQLQEPGKTKMYIDLGQISEDVIPNGSNDTEDGIGDNKIPNNIIDVGEDRGIDALFDEAERDEANYPFPLNLEDDPARDNYKFNFGKDDQTRNDEDFLYYNNWEGNALVSEIGQFPDKEVLNENNGQTIAKANDYFSYEVLLDLDPTRNKQIVGLNNGWALFRIPIRKPSKQIGNPSFSNIQYIRVWFKGGPIKAQIAEWRLVGANWNRISNFQNVPEDDSVMSIAFVNREENDGPPDYYTLPPGVSPPRQLNSPDPYQQVFQNEQSLSITVKNLRYGDERMATRVFRPLDIFFYKHLKFFIHGDGSMPDNVTKGSVPKALGFLRFGTDSANYYEYRRPLVRGWQDIGIELASLTAIKEARDQLRIFEAQTFPVPGDELATFTIKGNPILTKVQFFGVGIANPNERFPNELTTTLWVNELRLISPEKSKDWAGVGNMNIKLADLGSIDASFQMTEPNFHKLEERFGNRINTQNWSVSFQGNLEKFAPSSFKSMKLPISYTHAEFTQNPEFVANNDINLEAAANAAFEAAKNNGLNDFEAEQAANSVRRRSQTVKVQDSWALTGVQLGLPIDHWTIKETLNRLTMGYNYAQEFERSPVVSERFFWVWNLRMQYAVSLPRFLEVSPLKWADEVPILDTYKDWKLNFLPNNFSTGLNMARSRTTEQSQFLKFPSPVFRDFSAQRLLQFSWKFSEGGFLSPSLDYNVSTNSTLVDLEFNPDGSQRTGSEIANALFFKNGAFVDFGKNNMHTQTVTLNFTPKMPNIANISKFFDMSASYSSSYSWFDPLQPNPEIRDIAKNASYNANGRFNMGFKLKSLADGWWGMSSAKVVSPRGPVDTTSSIAGGVLSTIGKVFKSIFLDYDKIDFDISQVNTSVNPGVYGATGFSNFWGGVIGQSDQLDNGPSFPYQMGLVSSPHGGFRMRSSSSFPFFGFDSYQGKRPPNGVMQENYAQQTSFQIGTTRQLWPGATLDLSWQTDLGYSRNQTVLTDAQGNASFTNVMAMENLGRTYLAFPTIFGADVFGSNVENVITLYRQREAEIDNSGLDEVSANQAKQAALTESFHDGLEAFSFLSGAAGKFMPSVNWAFRWEGIEKWTLWDGFAKRVSLEHTYQSNYQEAAQITDNGRTVQSQQIQFGFMPLIGVTMGFDEKKVGGNLTASLRFNSTTGYQLISSNRSSIQRQATEEISLNASYMMKGWEFPFLGFNLKNDLEFSVLFSYKSNDRNTYDILQDETFEGPDNEGQTLDGNKQITFEPRARYSLSQRLTASFFIRYEKTITAGAANPGFSTTQIGLDIRLNFAGGR